eukprot:3935950-Rhodomonas_salina.1
MQEEDREAGRKHTIDCDQEPSGDRMAEDHPGHTSEGEESPAGQGGDEQVEMEQASEGHQAEDTENEDTATRTEAPRDRGMPRRKRKQKRGSSRRDKGRRATTTDDSWQAGPTRTREQHND